MASFSMVPFNRRIVPLSRIQVSRSRLRCNNVVAKRKAIQAIRKDGQQRPLIIDPAGQLLADTASYLALKALGYYAAEVVTLAEPSPVVVRTISRLLDRGDAIRREAAAFNSAVASLDSILVTGAGELVLQLSPVVITDTGEASIRLFPIMKSPKRRSRRAA